MPGRDLEEEQVPSHSRYTVPHKPKAEPMGLNPVPSEAGNTRNVSEWLEDSSAAPRSRSTCQGECCRAVLEEVDWVAGTALRHLQLNGLNLCSVKFSSFN